MKKRDAHDTLRRLIHGTGDMPEEYSTYVSIEAMKISDVQEEIDGLNLDADQIARRARKMIRDRKESRSDVRGASARGEFLDSLGHGHVMPRTVKRTLGHISLVFALGILGLVGSLAITFDASLESVTSWYVLAFIGASSSLLIIGSLLAVLIVLWNAFIYKHVEALQAWDDADTAGDFSFAFASALAQMETDERLGRVFDSCLAVSRERELSSEHVKARLISSVKAYFASNTRLRRLIMDVEKMKKPDVI